MLVSGANACYKTLKLSRKVKYVFGCPGTTELSILKEIANDNDMNYIFTLHENIAVGMADGFARASDQLGVVNLHATQGTLNAMGYIRVAQRDNSAILAIAGAPSTSYAFNEPNHFAYGIPNIVRHVTKWSWQINSTLEIPKIINRAANISLSIPKGPTYVAIPQDFLVNKAEIANFGDGWENVCDVISRGDANQINKASNLLLSANRPLIYSGNSVGRSHAVNALVRLAEMLGSPVISEALDRGPMLHSVNFPGDHQLFAGYFSRRNLVMTKLIQECDVLLEVGTKSTYPRVIGPLNPSTRVIQIDSDPLEIAKNHNVEVGIIGDAKDAIDQISKILEDGISSKQAVRYRHRFQNTKSFIASHRKRSELSETKLDGKPIKPKQLIKALRETLSEDVILVDDSQSFGYYLKTFYSFKKPCTLFGSMASHLGWALPASLGVKLAKPKNVVVCLVSDASLMISIQGLITACQHKIPVIIIVCNNHGFMSLKVEISSNSSFKDISNAVKTCEFPPQTIKISEIARAIGLESSEVSDAKELKEKIKYALSSNLPTLVDVDMSSKIPDWLESWYVPSEDKFS